MGWTGIHMQGRRIWGSNVSLLAQSSSYSVGRTWQSGGNEIEIEALRNGAGAVYGVLKHTNAMTRVCIRFALIVLVERDRKGQSFNYKEMTELDGPNVIGFPEDLFRKLSPLAEVELETKSSVQYAVDWRARVEARFATLKMVKTLKPGNVIELSRAASFTFGTEAVEVSRFRIVSWGKRRSLMALPALGEEFPCRLTRHTWQDNPFHIVV